MSNGRGVGVRSRLRLVSEDVHQTIALDPWSVGRVANVPPVLSRFAIQRLDVHAVPDWSKTVVQGTVS
jgi:hypothetical protein